MFPQPMTVPAAAHRVTCARWRGAVACLALIPAAGLAEAPAPPPAPTVASVATWRLPARIVAVGLPGVAGVRQIGRFHTGGPIPGNPEFLLQTDAGRVLDPQR